MSVAVSHILVPVDFSPHSDLALRYAAELASRLEASVELLHVVDDPTATGTSTSEVPVPDLPDPLKNVIAAAEGQLEDRRAVAGPSRVRTTIRVRTGRPVETITNYAHAVGSNLIVMGTHGRSGLAQRCMGSVAEHVVRHASCPVVTVRDFATGDKTDVARSEPAVLGFALGHFGTSRE